MGQVLAFSKSDARPPLQPPPRCDVRARRDMTLAELAQRLRLDCFTRRTQIDHLRALARHRSMPLPRNPRLADGVPVTGPAAIGNRSVWDRGEALAWLDGHHAAPPSIAAGLVEITRAALRNRAQGLVGAVA